MNKRTYHQFCGIAKALDLVGDRWTLLMVRDLLLGPLRFKDLLAGLPGLTTNLLAKRLKELEEADLIEKIVLPPPAGSTVYQLTADGLALEPVLMALGAWGWRFMDQPQTEDMTHVGWALLALKRRFKGTRGSWTVEVNTSTASFRLMASGKELEVARGQANQPDLKIQADIQLFRALFFAGEDPSHLQAKGLVWEVRGRLDAGKVWHQVRKAFGLAA